MLRNDKPYYAVLIAAAIAVYLNTLGNQFVYDDIAAILENRMIGRPLAYLLNPAMLLNSLAFRVGEYDPFLYHAAGIGVHAANVLLLFYFLRLFFTRQAAFLSALLFAVHPGISEAVAWISGRGYAVFGTFVFLTYICYHKAVCTARDGDGAPVNWKWYCASLACYGYFIIQNFSFFFAMPLVLVLSDMLFGRWRATKKLWLPFIVITAAVLLGARGAIAERIAGGETLAGAGTGWVNPLPRLVYSLFYHAGLFVWPVNLTLYHEPLQLQSWFVWAGGAALIVLLRRVRVASARAPAAVFGAGIFALFLLPTYLPIAVTSLIAERYLYAASIGLTVVAAFVLERFLSGKGERSRQTAALVVCIAVVLAGRTMLRNRDWQSSAVLWRATLKVSPGNAWAHNNMGYVYQQEGKWQEAIGEYEQAIALNPRLYDSYNNLASILGMSGKPDEAIAVYGRLLAMEPKFVKAYNNLGALYNQVGRKEESRAAYLKAIELKPDYAVAYFNLGSQYNTDGDFAAADVYLQKAVELDPQLRGLASQVFLSRTQSAVRPNDNDRGASAAVTKKQKP